HPSAPILPALFALGEVLDCTGRDLIAAYVAGFETETRIGRGVHHHHYEKGWHPTATLGVFGATAACCHLYGLDRAKTAQAPGLAVKQHPCCGSTHPAIDAMLLLRAEHDIAPDKVARIDSWTHPRRLAHTDRPDPGSGLDAKFSVQYCLARALLAGTVVLEDF